MPTRINKYLSEAGFCSRREADRLIQSGRVLINDTIPALATIVEDSDTVKVDGKIIAHANKMIYLLFNKPVGITCTTDTTIKDNIIDYINYPRRIFHVGRLDKQSSGLIIMTNDGDIVNEILRAEYDHEKEYVVTVDQPITHDFISGMAKGVPILDTITKPCKVTKTGEKTFKIILTEGLNRQIRRMCKHFNYQVQTLKRIRIMHLPLDVPTGKYRHLTDVELSTLFDKINHQ